MEQDARVMKRMLEEQRKQVVHAQRVSSRKRSAPTGSEGPCAKRVASEVEVTSMTNKEMQEQEIRARELAEMALSNMQTLASAAHTFSAAAQAASNGAALACLSDVNQDLQRSVDAVCAYAPIVARLASVMLEKLSHVQAEHKKKKLSVAAMPH